MTSKSEYKILVLLKELSPDQIKEIATQWRSKAAFRFEFEAFEQWDGHGIESDPPDLVLLDFSLSTDEIRSTILQIQRARPSLPALVIPKQQGQELEKLLKAAIESEAGQSPRGSGRTIDFDQELSPGEAAAPSKKVLLVDDNEDDRDAFVRALKKVRDFEYEVEEAVDGESALKELEHSKPDCLLLDYSLPGRNGLEVLTEVRMRYPNIPVIFLTGLGSQDVAVKALRMGAQDYISKSSVNEEILHQVILNACHRQALIQKVNEQRDTLEVFTRALAHDLKEPVRSIRSYMEIIMGSSEIGGENRELLERTASTAEHMSRLVDMVHDYTCIEEDGLSENRRSYDGNDLVDQALNNLSNLLEEIPNEIVIEDLPWVEANQPQAVTLFQNLISNALNYSDRELARVSISGRREGESVVFRVQDNGPGIPERFQERVFQPFKRLSDGHRKGSGLGLSICRKIVSKNGGEIGFEGGRAEGACVWFSLPAASNPRVELEAKRSYRSKPQGQHVERIANVLHVEDNPNDIMLTRMMLQKLDQLEMNIQAVNNGAEALALLEDENRSAIDLILLDINMPVMDGFEFLQLMKQDERFAGIPVIICSTSTDPRDRSSARRLGAQGYIPKPIRLSSLEPTLESINSIELCRKDQRVQLLARQGA
ncbi:response regulator [Pelagicoccus sp. SDUM812003]|uniref:response regulator n=1 Tax=Pelagicoccus sp. SDUM812003 TaxID=3041267 RepID=UPI00280EA90D|nr:response regulator [Pelagicoccus sp. SDUM812003]MDQ8202101.1 response regulator [Pelagicoccus sp. SDUM812003]